MDSLIELCSDRKLVQVRTYLASDATLAEKRAALMNKDSSGHTCLHHVVVVCYPRVPVDVITSMLVIGGGTNHTSDSCWSHRSSWVYVHMVHHWKYFVLS